MISTFQICRAANYFGHFVLPKYWILIVFQRLQDNPNRHELRVLANILQGSHPDSLAYHLEDMGLALQADNMCLLRNVRRRGLTEKFAFECKLKLSKL